MGVWLQSKKIILKEINLEHKNVLDVGCGNGWLLLWLSKFISKGIGIDPSQEQIISAQKQIKNSNVKFKVIDIENFKNTNEKFDLVFYFNSFHHIPKKNMFEALLKCSSCMNSNSIMCIVEPLAEGNFFEFMKDIDDETSIRSAAYKCIINSNQANLKIKKEVFYNEKKIFNDPESCIHSLTLANSKRSNYINKLKEQLMEKFYLLSKIDKDNKYEFIQPMRINLLKLYTTNIKS